MRCLILLFVFGCGLADTVEAETPPPQTYLEYAKDGIMTMVGETEVTITGGKFHFFHIQTTVNGEPLGWIPFTMVEVIDGQSRFVGFARTDENGSFQVQYASKAVPHEAVVEIISQFGIISVFIHVVAP